MMACTYIDLSVMNSFIGKHVSCAEVDLVIMPANPVLLLVSICKVRDVKKS